MGREFEWEYGVAWDTPSEGLAIDPQRYGFSLEISHI